MFGGPLSSIKYPVLVVINDKGDYHSKGRGCNLDCGPPFGLGAGGLW